MNDTTKIARELARTLQLAPERTIWLHLDEDLGAAFASLMTSAGALRYSPQPGDFDHLADAGAVLVENLDTLTVSPEIRQTICSVEPGGTVAVIIGQPPEGTSAEKLAEDMRPLLNLARARAHRLAGNAVMLSGPRRARLVGAKRKELRGVAHAVEPSILVGRAGITPEVIAATRYALSRHGLIKVKLTPQANLDKDSAAETLLWSTGAYLVQRVGKVIILRDPIAALAPPVSKNPRKR